MDAGTFSAMSWFRARWAQPAVRLVVLVLGLAAATLMIAGGVSALRLRGVADDLTRAERLLARAGAAVEDGRIGEGRADLVRASALVTRANGDLYNRPEYDIVGVLPPVAENLDALRESVGTTLTLVAGGLSILDAASPLVDAEGDLEVPLSEGAIPLDAVVDVGATLERISASVSEMSGGDSPFLLGQVTEVRDRVNEEVVRRKEQFGILGRALTVIADLAGANGDRRYLIAVANTAEMRGSGGMILNYGELFGSDGDFELGNFGRIDELALAEPITPEASGLPADYLRRWEGFDPLLRWRNATMAPDFTLVAPVMAAMYERARGVPVDGVIQIDPDGLAAILEGTGSVTVPELGVVRADNVVDLVLNEAYVRFPDIDERSDVLSEVAEAAFKRLVEGEYPSLRPLAEALVESAEERHIQAWARSGRIESLYQSFDVAGTLPDPAADAFTMTLQNLSANKLDYYVDTHIDLRGDPAGDGSLSVEIAIDNVVSPEMDSPKYVVGPNTQGQVVGEYRGALSLYVPVGTSLDSFERIGLGNEPTLQSEDGRTVIAETVVVPAGGRFTLRLELTLPPGSRDMDSIEFVPSPRIRPTTVAAAFNTVSGRIEETFAMRERTVLTAAGG